MTSHKSVAIAVILGAILFFMFVPVAEMNTAYCGPYLVPLETPHLVSLSFYFLRFGLVYGFGQFTWWGWGWCLGRG